MCYNNFAMHLLGINFYEMPVRNLGSYGTSLQTGWVCTQAALLMQRKVQHRCPPWGLWEPAALEQHTPLPYATIIILAKTDSKDTAWKVETATKITSEDASSEQLST